VEQPRAVALKVGAFVLVSTLLAFFVVVILGTERLWFAEKVTLKAAFPDVSGLKEGATVRLAGRDIGIVQGIQFSDDPDPARAVIVSFRVPAKHARRIKADSLARISSQGLLGDKLIDITLGSAHHPVAEDGAFLTGVPPQSLDQTIRAANGAIAEAEKTLAAARRIVEHVETGPGTLHALVYQDDLHESAKRAVRRADRLIAAVSPEEIQRVVGNVGRATDAVADAAGAIDRDALRRASRDVAEIVSHVKQGRGTLGGLLMDPTLYEETKRVVTNIRRNRVMRALTRYVISKEEPGEVMDARPDDVKVVPRTLPRKLSGETSKSSR
jgi:phospholipid/cholesterol/gamma-HCH transport system substrate-binding protein